MLKILMNFRYEIDAHVWITIFKNINFMLKCVIDQSYLDKFKNYLKDLLSVIKTKIRFEIKDNEGLFLIFI